MKGLRVFAFGVDEPLQAEREKETESRFSDAESDLEHSDLGTPAELWAKPWNLSSPMPEILIRRPPFG